MSQTPRELFEHLPRAEAIPRPAATSGLAYWRTAWSKRHTAATVAAVPLAWAVYSALTGPGAPLGLRIAVALTSLVAAVVLATFVPPRGTDVAATFSGCAIGSLMGLVAVGVLLREAAATPIYGWIALGVCGIALTQRLFTATSC